MTIYKRECEYYDRYAILTLIEHDFVGLAEIPSKLLLLTILIRKTS